jgi:hypothetical protein
MMQRHINTEITIDATPEEVWEALTDLDSYPNWNPYHVSVRSRGALDSGRRLEVDIHKPNGERVKIKPRVLRMEPLRELTWGGGIAGVFWGEHRFVLEPSRDGIRLIHSEDFTGFAVRYAGLDAVEEGYVLMNDALKSYVEAELARPNRSV